MALTLGQARLRLSTFAPPADLTNNILLACEKLLSESNPKDSSKLVTIRVSEGLLTLPREFLNVLGIAVDDVPKPVFNHWYSVIGSGVGVQDNVFNEVVEVGDGFPTFKDPSSVDEDGTLITVKQDISESGVSIVFKGIDDDAEQVRTLNGALYQDGETIVASVGGATSTTTFLSITQVVKPPCNGRIRVYSVDPADSSLVPIAIYEPSERSPSYRRYRVPRHYNDDGTDLPYTVTALCRIKLVDTLDDDNDVLPIGSLNALRDGLRYIEYVNANDMERAENYLQSALRTLGKEAARDRPASTFPAPIQIVNNTGWASGFKTLY